MMNPLPPVSPGKLGGRPVGAPQVAGTPLYAQPRDAQAILKADQVPDHPFDTPFSIIKTMQAELIRLREELQREQHERKVDVSNLKKEVLDLKMQAGKMEQKQQTDHGSLMHTIKELQIKEEHDWRTTRKEMEMEFAKRCFVTQHQALTDRVESTTKWLKETNELLNKQVGSLERKIQANADGDGEFAQEMKSELTSQRRQIDINTINDDEFAKSVLSRMQAAGQFLRTAGVPGMSHSTPDKTNQFSPRSSSKPCAPLGQTAMRALGALSQD